MVQNAIDEGDPAVVFASTDAGDDDYLRLATGSPAINMGNNDHLNNGTPGNMDDDIKTDATGRPRILNATVDLGAHEAGLLPQEITFTLPGTGTVGQTIPLAATTTSGLPIAYMSSASPVAEVVADPDGTTFTLELIGEGSATLTVSQVGDTEYAPAVDVMQTIVVSDPDTHRVTMTGAGVMDGNTWATATTLQAALTAATAGDQIWIAAGVYKPVTLAGGATTATEAQREATFSIPAGVLVYGGFEGTDISTDDDNFDPATGIDGRERTEGVLTRTTTLSGDLLGDDEDRPAATADQTDVDAYAAAREDNSYTVVMLANPDVTLDGLDHHRRCSAELLVSAIFADKDTGLVFMQGLAPQVPRCQCTFRSTATSTVLGVACHLAHFEQRRL